MGGRSAKQAHCMIFLAKVGCTGLDRVTSELVDIFDLFNVLIRSTLSVRPVANLD